MYIIRNYKGKLFIVFLILLRGQDCKVINSVRRLYIDVQKSLFAFVTAMILLQGCVHSDSVVKRKPDGYWQIVPTTGHLKARHEAGLVGFGDAIYLIGGRGIKPVNKLDPSTAAWTSLAKPPIEIHHFQPVAFNDEIYVIGAMTGRYPKEPPIANILIFNPVNNEWREGDVIPEDRRRGGAGVSVYKGKIYITGGITDGHWSGTVPWFDEYDPITGKWTVLSDMPFKRDHFQTAIVGSKLVAAGGRRSSAISKQVFNLLVNEVDVFDFEKQQWSTPTLLPTGRAGNSTFAVNGEVMVVGGESHTQHKAHNNVEVLNISTMSWHIANPLQVGRHGTGIALAGSRLWTVSGSGNRGGKPELLSTESQAIRINE